MTSRAEVLQRILNLYNNPSYLEVGVYEGKTFFEIKASKKVAVDPKFQFQPQHEDTNVTFHETTSDRYFGELILSDERFDVIFLDGLHTFEQTLRDLLNSLSYLNKGGVIVIDDILPNSYQASLADYSKFKKVKKHMESADESWMGDVFKLSFFIQTFFQQFSFATVKENRGQLVMWSDRRHQERIVERKVGEIDSFDFSDMAAQFDEMNLTPLDKIVEAISRSLKN